MIVRSNGELNNFINNNELDNRYYTKTETDTQISNRMSGFKNGIINPTFEINQYANIDTAPVAMVHDTYQIDRFMSSAITVTGTVQRLAKRLIGGKYVNTVRCVATSSATGRLGLIQKSELFYNGETKTFGVWVKSNSANARALLYDGVTVHESSAHTGGGNDEFLSFSSTINLSATQLLAYVQLCGAGGISTPITTGNYIESTMWQLEDGSVPTKFEQRDKNFEKDVLCKPFLPYREMGSATVLTMSHGVGVAANPVACIITLDTKVKARTIPTAVTYGGALALYDGATAIAVSSISIHASSCNTNAIRVSCIASGLTAAKRYELISNNDATAYVQIQTEL